MMAQKTMSRLGSVVDWDIDNGDMAAALDEGKGNGTVAHERMSQRAAA